MRFPGRDKSKLLNAEEIEMKVFDVRFAAAAVVAFAENLLQLFKYVHDVDISTWYKHCIARNYEESEDLFCVFVCLFLEVKSH